MKPNEITSLGMARTFQNIRLFPTMTVLENVMIGRHCRTSAGIAGAVFQDSRTKAEEQATIDRSYELLREVGLNMIIRTRPGTCPTEHSAVWRSPALWRPIPPCCCSTNPPRA